MELGVASAAAVVATLANAGFTGSSGLGSVSSELIDRSTFEMVRAGDHWSFKMSRQIRPRSSTLG